MKKVIVINKAEMELMHIKSNTSGWCNGHRKFN